MSAYFSIFFYTVEYNCKYPCALEDEWEAVSMDEYVFQVKHFARIMLKNNDNKISVILFNYL